MKLSTNQIIYTKDLELAVIRCLEHGVQSTTIRELVSLTIKHYNEEKKQLRSCIKSADIQLCPGL